MEPWELPPPPDQWADISTFPRYLRWMGFRFLSFIGLTLAKVLVALAILAVMGALGGAIIWGVLLLGRNG